MFERSIISEYPIQQILLQIVDPFDTSFAGVRPRYISEDSKNAINGEQGFEFCPDKQTKI